MSETNSFFSGAQLIPGKTIDFEGIYKKLRALAPKCPKCNGFLEDPNAGQFKKAIRLEEQGTMYICSPCYYDDLGEALLNDTPK